MNKLVIVYTDLGMLCGEVVNENLDGDIELKNPVNCQRAQNQMYLIPLLESVTEDSIIIKKSEIRFSNVFTPAPQVVDHYTKMFSAILTPSSSLTLVK